MNNIETISEYVNIFTRLRAAVISATTITAGLTSAEVAAIVQDMMVLSEGKDKQGLQKDLKWSLETIQLLEQLAKLAEGHIGYDTN